MNDPARTPDQLIDDLLYSIAHKADGLNLTDEEITPHMGKWFLSREKWSALQTVLIEEARTHDLKSARAILEANVREKVISDWVELHVNAKEYDKKTLKREIEFLYQ
jgi:hypothetical protein